MARLIDKEEKSTRKKAIPESDFIEMVQSSKNLDELMDKTEMTKTALKNRLSQVYIKQKITLDDMETIHKELFPPSNVVYINSRGSLMVGALFFTDNTDFQPGDMFEGRQEGKNKIVFEKIN